VTAQSTPAFASVVLDVDSTLAGIEGIDWLAQRRGDLVARQIASLTDEAMRGQIPLEQIYRMRLAKIRPRRDEVDELARAYVDALAPDCAAVVTRLRRAGVEVVLVSGGLRNAMLRMALHLDFDLADVHAVDIRFDAVGAYTGFDEKSPLTTSNGKRALVERLALARPILAVGDGVTDLVVRDVVDTFAAYTGFVVREPVVRDADVVLESFTALAALVLG
jgi:HAD superfamily phosphoserine phosphatase-like hydrolase